MDLSIIILDFHLKNLIKYCIKNIKETVHDLNYEIIVIDNGSKCGTEEMLKELYPDVRFIQNGENFGFAKGNNIAIKQAKGDYIMIMNPDITVKQNAINNIVDYIKQHPEVGLVGPKLLNPNETLQYTAMKFQTFKSVFYRRTFLGKTKKGEEFLNDYQLRDWDHNDIREVDWVMGACQTVRKSDLDKVGMFDERFFFYVEDMELCRRFWMNDLKVIYLPTAQMYHLHEQASMTSPYGFLKLNKLVRWHITSFIKYSLKYFRNKNYGTIRSKNTKR